MKNKNFKTMKKTSGYITILHKCTKNHDHMPYCYWDMMHDKCNCYFPFSATFCPALLPRNSPKNQHFIKNGKNTQRYHQFTQFYQKPWSFAILLLRYFEKEKYLIFNIWYLEKEKTYDIKTLTIDRVLNKEDFYGKITHM